ncbi:hypothetical protein RJ639_041496 [Escallonia herrerae]|uniref:Pentatricopeptide repeat-containing protein n=1 Tax=Escallonia herrerae TaxID=1293975 RepID=A0AA88WIQ6_9ASTE|nr:hypothetical protein RJ639_041496 [Escallonia herrerae]
MKRCSILFSAQYCQAFSYYSRLDSARTPLPFLSFFLRNSLVRRLSSCGSATARPFPDYSPKRPTIRESELVYHVSTTIKQRCCEPLHRILKPFESKFRPDHFIWVLMNIKDDYKLVLDFFDWLCLRRDPSLEARCIVIQIAAAAMDPDMAHRLLRDFWTKPNLDVSLSFARFVEKLIYTYKDWGSNSYVFDIFFQVLVEVGFFSEAKILFGKLINYGLVISVDSCNLLLACLSNNTDGHEMVLEVFNNFLQVGVCWNTASHNIAIHSLCQMRRMKEAHHLLLQMELRGCVSDVVGYSTVINGYCHAGEFQTMLRILEDMQMKSLKPNAFTLNSIILLLCKTGKVVDAERVFREMRCRGIEPDTVVYTTLIDGLCKIGDVKAAYRLFNMMQSQNIVPDIITFTALILGLCQTGNIGEANKLFDGLLSRGLEPDDVTYTVLIDGMLEDGERLLKWMLEKGIMPNATTYNSLLKQYCITKNMNATTEIYWRMHGQGVMPNDNTYNILIRGHCKARNMKEAWFLHKEMIEKGFKLSVESYNALIKGFLKRKKYVEATELFKEMRKEGLVADRELYNIFVDMNYDDGNLDMTLDLCDEAVENCIMDKTTNTNS